MELKAAIQALQKAEKLKEGSLDLLDDDDAWIRRQRLLRIYRQVLILDLEYALDRKVEQDLWSHGFKNYIVALQTLAKDKKNPKRPESQAMLSCCLEAASGFYLTLLQDICTAFDLDLTFRRKGSVYGTQSPEVLNPPHSSSCNYICQHCLVHLGDISRYRGQNRQAEAFYRHAVLPAPGNGHPYNQLALLEASRGDRLGTVFQYVRSVAVRFPFPAATNNLAITLDKSDDKLCVDGRTKLSASEYVSVFLKFHGLLRSNVDLDTAERCVKLLTSTLTAHVATETITSWKLVQMLVINLFALRDVCVTDDNEGQQVKRLVLDLMAGSLNAFLLPVHTFDEGRVPSGYYALPAIKLTLDWIRLEPSVLLHAAFTSRLQIWPSLCKLLNGLQPIVADFKADEYADVPLPEDRDVQCFRPLEPALRRLAFDCDDRKCDPPSTNQLRAGRLTAFGRWLAGRPVPPVCAREDDGTLTFEAVGQQMPSGDVIRELEELSLACKMSSPAPSETGSRGSCATPDNLLASPHATPVAQVERRAGILKPQGSLEKSREKETPAKRVVGSRNVALQAIMRKAYADVDVKQVTFKSPSPSTQKQSYVGARTFPSSCVGQWPARNDPTPWTQTGSFRGSASRQPSSEESFRHWSVPASGDGANPTTFSSDGGGNAYSLFSSPDWAARTSCGIQSDGETGSQSLWSGPGPSPLERLLEQQKQLREGPAPEGGT